MILSTKDPAGVEKSVQIPADEPFSVSLAWDMGTRATYGGIEFMGCTPTVTFTPKDGESYSIGQVAGNACSLYLKDGNGSAVARTQRNYSGGAAESSSFCR